jgi:predicted dehydrogenase
VPDHVTQVLLVGAGSMAVAYANVLLALDVPFRVVGRSPKSCRTFEAASGVPVAAGGVEQIGADDAPSRAIVAVSATELVAATTHLISVGVGDILVEKPAALDRSGLELVAACAARAGTQVLVAYNRRYYASVERARQLIHDDGGVTSFSFEFTEWPTRVLASGQPDEVLAAWFMANSTHVVDLAFHLGGWPSDLAAFVTGGGLAWHEGPSVFAGSGTTNEGALFSYAANWQSPGRWGVELLTRHRRLVLRPLEQLQEQRAGELEPRPVEIEDQRDQRDRLFKPGLYEETSAFLSGGASLLPAIDDQVWAEREVYAPMIAGGVHRAHWDLR